jgi:IS4 transposase
MRQVVERKLAYLFSHPELRRRGQAGQEVRVIDYQLKGVESAEPFYRVVTSVLDPRQAPAEELASVYGQRWELENALDELKIHLRGPRVVLRSKTPQLVFQEFYGLLLAHFCVAKRQPPAWWLRQRNRDSAWK